MKKKLRIDELRIETFATERASKLRGTVRGHDDSWDCTMECTHEAPTCDYECGASFPWQKECVATDYCSSDVPC